MLRRSVQRCNSVGRTTAVTALYPIKVTAFVNVTTLLREIRQWGGLQPNNSNIHESYMNEQSRCRSKKASFSWCDPKVMSKCDKSETSLDKKIKTKLFSSIFKRDIATRLWYWPSICICLKEGACWVFWDAHVTWSHKSSPIAASLSLR